MSPRAATAIGCGASTPRGVTPMERSDILYILALMRLERLQTECPETLALFLVTISKLTSLRASMKMLETDLQIRAFDSFNSLSPADLESLYRGRELIEELLRGYYNRQTSNVGTTSGSSTT